MIRKKTVFVVGAGASAEVGLPVGSGLMGQIRDSLVLRSHSERSVRENEILDALDQHSQRSGHISFGDYREAARIIHEAMPLANSIDNFIDNHRGDEAIEVCAKLAIFQCIIHAERASTLYQPKSTVSTLPFANSQHTWFNLFFRLISENVGKDTVQSIFENVSIICFNYDRCIEHYLFHSLKTAYILSDKEALEIMDTLIIRHPYGSLGLLPWKNRDDGIGFGAVEGCSPLVNVFPRIRTFTQEFEDKARLDEMRSLCEEAERIVFLGFAYHEMNLKLLGPVVGPKKGLMGTILGISAPNYEVVRSQVRDCITSEMYFEHFQRVPCRQLLDDYSKVITQS